MRDEAEPSDRLTPVYPTTEGLHQQSVRRIVERALAALEHETLEDYLAPALASRFAGRQRLGRRSREALRYLHRRRATPRPTCCSSGRHPCSRRIALEELIAQRLSLRRSAAATRTERARPLPKPAARLDAFRAALPFALTRAQAAALDEIVADLGGSAPMNRLLQGDVGSGKTVVAAMAALVAAAAGCQTAVMAPTELLAEQHFASFERWLAPLGVEVAALIGAQPARARAATLAAVADGRAAVVVGTHALFQESVEFRQLALVDRRRAASLRRRAAAAAEAEGRGRRARAAPAHHDRDADSADARDDGVCGSRLLRDRRAAAGPPARADRRACPSSAAPSSSSASRRIARRASRPTGFAR